MSNELLSKIAKESTSQEIKQAVENIETIVVENGGTDWSKYSPMSYLKNLGQAIEYEILGEGYVSVLGIKSSSNSGAATIVTLEIDESVYNLTINTSTTAPPGFSGLAVNPNFYASNRGQIGAVGGVTSNPSAQELQSSGDLVLLTGTTITLDQPLFFKSKLKISVIEYTSTEPEKRQLYMRGGVAL